MKRTFAWGFFLGMATMLPAAAGATFWIMNELQRTRSQVLFIEAHADIKNNQLNSALAKLNQSIGAYPYDGFTHLTLAELYQKTGDMKLALEQYQITKVLCGDCYRVDDRISRLQRELKGSE